MFNEITNKIYRFISSKKFFYFIVGLLFVQAAWFALTAMYPMAFDEQYHFGVTKLYSNRLSPFISSMPEGTGEFGDLTRYGSYAYHFLLSFPFRLIALFTQNQIIQIIILRFINIFMFIGGLVLFRRLLRRVKISESISNLSLLVLVLIPVVPFLAATINYDNAIFLLLPLTAILTLKCRDQIIKSKKLSAKTAALFINVGILSSLTKYTFLPIFVAEVIYLFITIWRTKSFKIIFKSILNSLSKQKRWLQILTIVSVIFTSGLFIERYGINMIKYHSPEPECGQVQSVDHCMSFGPWGRNYNISIKVAQTNPPLNPPVWRFLPAWFEGMIHRLFFAINYNYSNFDPLPIPIYTASVIGFVGLILLIIFWRKIILIDKRMWLFVSIICLYTASLLYINFSQYIEYRKMLAINGRYLVIIFPMLFALIGLAYKKLIIKIFKYYNKWLVVLLTTILFILLLQGGGALTYLIQSKSDWYFQNQTIIDFNLGLQKIVKPFIIGS